MILALVAILCAKAFGLCLYKLSTTLTETTVRVTVLLKLETQLNTVIDIDAGEAPFMLTFEESVNLKKLHIFRRSSCSLHVDGAPAWRLVFSIDRALQK